MGWDDSDDRDSDGYFSLLKEWTQVKTSVDSVYGVPRDPSHAQTPVREFLKVHFLTLRYVECIWQILTSIKDFGVC